MPLRVKTVISFLEDLAPASIALSGDPVGLQLGNPETEVKKILVALDPDLNSIEEAAAIGAEMLVTHHPLFFHKLSSVNESQPEGALIAFAIRSRLNIYSMHTNYDVTPMGVTYQLAKTLDLPVDNAEVLEVSGSEQLLKLVVFVPAGHEDEIRNVLAGAGAGQVGNYSHCTFQTKGTGTFMPGEGTNPYIGSSGQLEKVDEIRLETILPAARRAAVVKALFDVHPYEEPAYDLYPLDLEAETIGLGLLISPEKPLTLDQILEACTERLKTDCLRFRTAGKSYYNRIALCGGSGGSLIAAAAGKQADILISGDFGYHDLKLAEALGIALIDAGHHATEKPGIDYLRRYLENSIKAGGYRAEVCLQASLPAGWDKISG